MKVRLKEAAVLAGHKHVGNLVPGRAYVVLEVATSPKRMPSFRVEASEEPYNPILAEGDALELISDELPSCWRAGYSDGYLSLSPHQWRDAPFEDSFWGAFFDENNREVFALYRQVRDEIYRESGVEPPNRPDWPW